MKYYVEYGNEFFDEFSVPAMDEADAEALRAEKAKSYKFANIVIFVAGT